MVVSYQTPPVRQLFLHTLVLFLFSFVVDQTQAETLTLYNHTNGYGDFILLNVKGCTNVPKKWRDHASSLDVHGSCQVFYDDFDCLGKRVSLQPHHRKYMDNLETVGFNDMIKSVRPCGPKLQRGIHVIQSPMDGTVLTIKPEKGEFYANTGMEYWRRKKTQLWSIGKYGPRVGINYDMAPIAYPYYNPVTYTKFESKKNALGESYMPRRFFDVQPLPENKYLIKILHTDKCLVNNGRGKSVGKTVCAPWMSNQQWQFIRVDRAVGNRYQPAPIQSSVPGSLAAQRPPFL